MTRPFARCRRLDGAADRFGCRHRPRRCGPSAACRAAAGPPAARRALARAAPARPALGPGRAGARRPALVADWDCCWLDGRADRATRSDWRPSIAARPARRGRGRLRPGLADAGRHADPGPRRHRRADALLRAAGPTAWSSPRPSARCWRPGWCRALDLRGRRGLPLLRLPAGPRDAGGGRLRAAARRGRPLASGGRSAARPFWSLPPRAASAAGAGRGRRCAGSCARRLEAAVRAAAARGRAGRRVPLRRARFQPRRRAGPPAARRAGPHLLRLVRRRLRQRAAVQLAGGRALRHRRTASSSCRRRSCCTTSTTTIGAARATRSATR